MGRFVNPDNSAFQVALNSKIYVDKTGLIEYTNSVLDTTDAYICNSRPRRFGKSYAANMLAAYYSKGADSEKMFSGLEISKDVNFKRHLNKYDLIHIDIQWFLANCVEADNVVDFISDKGFDKDYGARPIRRALQTELEDVLAETVLMGDISIGDTVDVLLSCEGTKKKIVVKKKPFADEKK